MRANCRMALLAVAIGSAGCVSVPREPGLAITNRQARAVRHAVWMHAPACGRVERLAVCPGKYQEPQAPGKCVLAFVAGTSTTDPDALFFRVQLDDGEATVWGKFSGTTDFRGLQITSSCEGY